MEYKISTVDKKQVQIIHHFRTPSGKRFTIEEWWRWGTAYVTSTEDLNLDVLRENAEGLNVYDYTIEDQSSEDLCSLYINKGELTDEEYDIVTTIFEDAGDEGLEEDGYVNEDSDFIMHGPLEIEPMS